MNCSEVDEIILVTGSDEIDYCSREIVEKYNFQKVRAVIAGGKERYDSVYEGLKALSDCDYVLIHDGARPLISSVLINANISCVQEKEACITAVPAKDTIKVVDNKGYVADTLERSKLWQIQTPQTFPMPLYQKHIEKEQKRGIPPSQTMPWLLKNMPIIHLPVKRRLPQYQDYNPRRPGYCRSLFKRWRQQITHACTGMYIVVPAL